MSSAQERDHLGGKSDTPVVKTKEGCRTPNSEIRNTHVNIGTGVDISIRELAETVKEIIGFEGELYFNADKPDGMMLKLTDPSKLHDLGWQHTVELEDGIGKMYAWYIESLGQNRSSYGDVCL